MLRAAGYEVVCIDQKQVHGQKLTWTQIPNGARDETGDRPITERARWLKHAAFFVGNSSGLAWLAWAAGTPVVLISGFTHPNNEFETPYRVINWHACNSCWNDVRVRFDHRDYMWCPRHGGTDRQFECTRLITAAQVIVELVAIAQQLKLEFDRGGELGLSPDELAFYDAVCQNDAAVMEMGNETLKRMAAELVRVVRSPGGLRLAAALVGGGVAISAVAAE